MPVNLSVPNLADLLPVKGVEPGLAKALGILPSV